MYCPKWDKCNNPNQNHKDCQIMDCFGEATKSPQAGSEAVSECMELLNAIVENKEVCLSGQPVEQFDADEPRYEVTIVGPERLIKQLCDLF